MKKNVIILLIVLISCSPDRFHLNYRSMETEEISGLIVGSLDSVEVYAKNALKIYDGGMVDLICFSGDVTQFRADITAEITQGSGLRFAFRTIINNYVNQPSVTFDFTENGCFIHEDNKLLTKVDSIRAKIGEKSRILIENYGKLVNIVVDCDTVYYGSVSLPATEHVIIHPLKNSNIDLSGIFFSKLNGDILNKYIK